MSDTALRRHSRFPPAILSALPLVLRIALRDLRAGMTGFLVFVICIALGVAAIAGVGSLARALSAGLAQEGRAILGGDLALSTVHRRASAAERADFRAIGPVSEIATLRAMARGKAGEGGTLVRIKAVDALYPLYGALGFSRGDAAAVRERGTAAAEPLLFEQLGVEPGGTIRVGDAEIRVTATLSREPDQLSTRRLAVGPRLIMSLETLRSTGLVQPGSLIRWHYRIKAQAAGDEALAQARERLEERYSDAGFTVLDRRDPNPRLTRAIDRVGQFLTLAGIATLMIGGVGVANTVSAYLARKRATIAAFKCLGASGGTIFRIYLTECLLLAGGGTLAGLAAGALMPPALAALLGDGLPLRLEAGIYPSALALGALYGIVTAVLFILWPLGRARRVSAAALLRQNVSGERQPVGWPCVLGSVLCAALLAGVAIAGAESRLIAAWAVAGLAAVFLFFLGAGRCVEALARAMPRPRNSALALARASLAGPGSLARPVILSLGASLSLLAAVSLVNASLTQDLRASLPANAPTYYALDIPRDRAEAFLALVERTEPAAQLARAPMLRGRIVRVKGVPAKDVRVAPAARWAMNGDRGLTYSQTLPEGSKLVKGAWWPRDYEGPPLVSFEQGIAEGIGVDVGDRITVNVLGRPVEATIANLRAVNWESLSINFVMVFSPNTLRAAPHNFIATITLPPDVALAREAALARAVAQQFPAVTLLRVRDAINAFAEIAEKVMAAIRAASAFTLVIGAVVLAGALSLAHPRRVRETVIFKTLGATRRRIVAAHLAEYALLALAAGAAAMLLGTLGAWAIVTQVMEAAFSFSWAAVLQPVLFACALVLLLGAWGTWRVLSAGTARRLRDT
ncbi:MAG: ABC transporter permease [Methyloligellaceae bacterium]